METIVVVGAGLAGLAAADALSEAGAQVIILEARPRAGGRLLTVHGSGGVPIDLGAEFVHGSKVATWKPIRGAGLKTHEVPGKFWEFRNNQVTEQDKFEEPVGELLKKIKKNQPDRSVGALMQECDSLDAESRRRATAYVEGFHAAPIAAMSAQALALAEKTAEKEGGDQQFRITGGYGLLVEYFLDRLNARGVKLLFGHRVTSVQWERGAVRLTSEQNWAESTHEGVAAVIAVPLGVLQQTGAGAIQFAPELPRAKRQAIDGLAMGSVVKITLQFHQEFWPVKNFGFLHIPDAALPTWWSDERGALLTGWAGGPQAYKLADAQPDEILQAALKDLSRAFKLPTATLRDLLQNHFIHDWLHDPYSLGAYCFTPVGMLEMPKALAGPLASTLFFAGEATNSEGEQGTVHAALESGQRVFEEIRREQSVLTAS
jgi:monoamine oxidase